MEEGLVLSSIFTTPMSGVHNEKDWYLSFLLMTILIGEWYGHVFDARGRGEPRELELGFLLFFI